MESYLVLGLIYLVIWALAFWLFGKELLCPASLVPLVMLAGVVLALVGTGTWNHWTLGAQCIALLSIAVIAFVIGCFLSKRFLPKAKAWATPIDRAPFSAYVQTWKFVVLLAVVVTALVWHAVETIQIAEQAGIAPESYAQAASWVRQQTSSVFSGEGVSLTSGFSLIDRFLNKCTTAISYVAIVWCLVSFRKKDWRSFAMSLALVAAKVMYVFLEGSRGGAFVMVLAIVLGVFILSLRGSGRKNAGKLSIKLGAAVAVIAVLGSAVFYASGSLVGRTANSSLVEYISFYFGCGIPAFERTLTEGAAQFDLIGFNTFHEQYYLLHKIGLIGDVPAYGDFWYNMGGHACNVFTFAYRYYADFGIIGVLVLPVFAGFVYTLLYERAFRPQMHPASLAMFLLVGQQLFDVERDAKLFSTLFTANTLITVVIMAIIGVWLYAPVRRGKHSARRPAGQSSRSW